ncbi:MAG: hypothetical protein ACYCVL_00080 [Gemmatimonadaceae bacterium]
MDAFSWRDDLRKVRWGATARLNMLRACAAGLVWAVIVLIASWGQLTAPGATPWWAIPFIAGLGYVGFVITFLLAAKIMTAVGGDAGKLGVAVVTFVSGLAIAVGDPLVFVLHRKNPARVPVEKFRPVNVVLVLFVLDPIKARVP